MVKIQRLVFLLAWLTLASLATADIKMNEIYRNPEDLVDGDEGVGREFFELISTTGSIESMSGLTLVEINGQDFPETGTITQAFDLSSYSTGQNGLFLWRDSADELIPAPAAGTSTYVELFDPHLADDNVTYALVSGFTGTVGTDLDANDDGVLDSTPWASVEDAMGVLEGGEPGFSYSTQLGGADFVNVAFGPDAFARTPGIGQWFAFDSGSGEEDPNYFGPFYANDPGDNELEDGTSFNFGEDSTFYAISPGSLNAAVPEPSALVLALMAALAMVRFRR